MSSVANVQLQLQGDPVTIRTIFVPIISSLRLRLGFISSSQLITRLNNSNIPSAHCTVLSDPHQLVTAWLVVRLRAASEPHQLVDDLLAVRARLSTHPDEDTISDVLDSFGLLSRSASSNTASILGLSGLMSPQTGSDHSYATSPDDRPARSRVSLLPQPRISHRKPARKGSSTTAKWWSHRRNNSSASRMQDPATVYPTERRPSLSSAVNGIFGSDSGSPSAGRPALGHPDLHHSSSSSIDSDTHASRRHSRLTVSDTPTMSDLLASLMTYDNPEDVRFILLDYLLAKRYRLAALQRDDWCLGHGRDSAEETVTGIESRLVGRKDVMGLRSIFDDLRTVFDLPRTPQYGISAYRGGPRALSQGPIRDPDSTQRAFGTPLPSALTEVPVSGGDRESRTSALSAHRDVSFDLDQYLLDISPLDDGPEAGVPVSANQVEQSAPRRESTTQGSAEISPVISQTCMSDRRSRSAQCSSMLSVFTIKQATRVYPQETSATQYQLPRRVISLSEMAPAINVFDSLREHNEVTLSGSRLASTNPDAPQKNRASQSDPELVEKLYSAGSGHANRATDTTARNSAATSPQSLRRVPRLRGRLHHHISAYELGLAHALPRVPATPTLPPLDFDAVEDFCGKPIAIPTVPSVSLASSSSASGSLRITINKNLAGLDTPPASPPIVDSSTISYSLGEAPDNTTRRPPASRQARQRHVHRQCFIVDGINGSSPEGSCAAANTDDKSEDNSSEAEAPEAHDRVEISRTSIRSSKRSVVAHSSTRTREQVKSSDANGTRESPVTLQSILQLFNTARGEVQPRAGLGEEEVRKVVKRIVRAREVGDRCQRWLLLELLDLVSSAPSPSCVRGQHLAHLQLGTDFAPMVNYYLNNLSPLSPFLSPLPLPHLNTPGSGTVRHGSQLSLGSSNCPLPPSSASPASLFPRAVSEPETGDSDADDALLSAESSTTIRNRGSSVATVDSHASIYTFGTPGLW